MSTLYETNKGDSHQHLVCRSCGFIKDTNCFDVASCLQSTDHKGFNIDEA